MAAISTSAEAVSSAANPLQVGAGKQVLLLSGGSLSSAQPIQIISQLKSDAEAAKRRELLARQPSYCKILNDLKEAESSESEDSIDHKNIVMKGETVDSIDNAVEAAASRPGVEAQTVLINGETYQVVSPSSMDNVINLNLGALGGGGSTYTNSNGGTVFIPSTNSSTGVSLSVSSGSPPGPTNPAEEQARKREIRLMKNREAARECRNKKKEYIKCLENRVAVLENQNKALIEELKTLKELYTKQN